ncbi:nuclear transport factor 2 family protein [Azospirillum sp. SYSU D00513]|uniref:nuclear transport factor 2 family protein n=1 Tax=Azospirillum sp. SYSU D00513 TaxID=2812561 RepID=UPI001A974104|nr:nuclear transport factor 2 family protein [Azospirillum sp. SYSU D00513]
MGIATRMVKEKVKTAAVGPGMLSPSQVNDLLEIEEDFYKTLTPSVFLVAEDVNSAASAVWSQVKALWAATCIDQKVPDGMLHDDFRGVFSGVPLVDSKESKLAQIEMGSHIRAPISVRLLAKSCTICDSTAFVIYDYLWKYMGRKSKHAEAEQGSCVQTWVQRDGQWVLIGEYVEQKYVESMRENG